MKAIIQSFLAFTFLLLSFSSSVAQHSIAREWNEILLESIRADLARPTVHARNLWHTSAIMYDIWAIFDEEASPYFCGNEINGFQFVFDGFDTSGDQEAKINEAISHAVFSLLDSRFRFSPQSALLRSRYREKMTELGYDFNFVSTDYSTGNAAALGNYIGQTMINYGFQDGSRENFFYRNAYYQPSNPPMVIQQSGNPNLVNPNNWQQLTLDVFIDQSGNVIPFNTPDFLSPEWGNVDPFSFEDTDKTVYTKNGTDVYNVFLDPGPPPFLDFNDPDASYEYIRGFELVLKWSSQLDPADQKMVDISPASNGNNPPLPVSAGDILAYYDYANGGDFSEGHDLNPVTGMPYEPQMVPFGDYTRVLAEFWADGPDSETPPGHWFSILNYVNDHPLNTKQYVGQGQPYEDLEWDVKSYFMLGGAMHDAAITAWSVKGYYDYIRPVSAIRYLAQLGQRTDPSLPNYSPFGFALEDGFLELVGENDPLVGANQEHLNKLKAFVWRGPDYINNPDTDQAGVGWILVEDWWPYQRPSFVTPPFAGYVSGHSTYSRAAAEILTKLTGSAYFPGGMGEFSVEQNEFLVFEEGPSESFTLQWATYRDASDETSLSRIWGGIHPPADDIPGRIMGGQVAEKVFAKAESLFFVDADNDGFYSYQDCDDQNAAINPFSPEICDDIDNDCNGDIDDGLPLFTYYLDSDNDGFGDGSDFIEICDDQVPAGYSVLSSDCNDGDPTVNSDVPEICNGIDDDCNGLIDDDIDYFNYYRDLDGDGFGDLVVDIFVCDLSAPAGYVDNSLDCDDTDPNVNPNQTEIVYNGIDDDCNALTLDDDLDEDGFSLAEDCDDNSNLVYPGAPEISDNGIDEDCDGIDYFAITKIFPNPFTDQLTIHLDKQEPMQMVIYNALGQSIYNQRLDGDRNVFTIDGILPDCKGLLYIYIFEESGELFHAQKLLRI